jgi:hypothetical protein
MEEFIMTQEAFDRLWQRVQGAEAVPTRRNDTDTLRAFLDETAQAFALERRLQMRCAELSPLCRETFSRLRRLRAAFYLQTGERHCPPETCSVRGGLLPDLRADCLASRARAGRYAAAAETAPDDLHALYEALSAEEQTQSERLAELLCRLL